MIKLNKLTIKTNKGRTLIENLTLNLNEGNKLAIIGEEGNGKSTILKAIYNQNLIFNYCFVEGEIFKDKERVGYLEQKLANNWHKYRVSEFLTKNSPEEDADYSVYESFSKVEKYVSQFKLNDILQKDNLISELSGGEQVKLQLLKILLQQPTLLLLDEPTNDLDIPTLIWLENFIKNYNKPIIFISHDEELLTNCANRILHIEQLVKKQQPKFTLAECGYQQYVTNRKQQIEKQTKVAGSEQRKQKKQEEILQQIKQKVENGLNKVIRNPIAGRLLAKKMANVKAQEKKLKNKELTEMPEVEEAVILLVNSSVSIPNNKQILNVNLKELKAGNKMLSKNIKLSIRGANRVAIVGANGSGKTTVLKVLLPILSNTTGLKVGYFSQNYYESLNYKNTPITELMQINPNKNIQTILGSLKFTLEEMNKPISTLSEGQKAKLLLLKLVTDNNNVLLLDEPTRNLSPLTNPVVCKLLQNYKGAIITVSHDRAFIKALCNEVYELTKDGLTKIEI